MRKAFILIIVTLLSIDFAYAQETEIEKSEEVLRNSLSLDFTYTFIRKGTEQDNLNDRGHFIPGFGAAYFRKLNTKWEVGVMIDIEFGSYVIPRKDDLKRENALILAFMSAYNITPKWNIMAGGGVELEKHEHLGLFRIGTEYKFPLGNEWFIPLSVLFDLKEGYDSWSWAVGVGKEF